MTSKQLLLPLLLALCPSDVLHKTYTDITLLVWLMQPTSSRVSPNILQLSSTLDCTRPPFPIRKSRKTYLLFKKSTSHRTLCVIVTACKCTGCKSKHIFFWVNWQSLSHKLLECVWELPFALWGGREMCDFSPNIKDGLQPTEAAKKGTTTQAASPLYKISFVYPLLSLILLD